MPDTVEIIAPTVTPEPALRDAVATIAYLRGREATLIEACSPVADGGQYRADIVSAIQRDRRELEKLRAENTRDQLLIGVQRGRADKLLAACVKALEHSAAGEDLSVERVLKKAIADAGGLVAAPVAPARPEVVQASDRGAVADVLRLLREDPSKQIAVICASYSDCFDRYEALLAALRIVHGNNVVIWAGPIPGIQFRDLGSGVVRFFVTSRGLGLFLADVVIDEAGVSTCPLNLCDGSGAIETSPATGIGGPDPQPADGHLCDCERPSEGEDTGDSLAAFMSSSVSLDTALAAEILAKDPYAQAILAARVLAPAKLTRQEIVERAAVNCVAMGPQSRGEIALAVYAALRDSSLDPYHAGEVNAVLEAKMDRSAVADVLGYVYGLRTIEGKVS